jgi:hypothetical protein
MQEGRVCARGEQGVDSLARRCLGLGRTSLQMSGWSELACTRGPVRRYGRGSFRSLVRCKVSAIIIWDFS